MESIESQLKSNGSAIRISLLCILFFWGLGVALVIGGKDVILDNARDFYEVEASGGVEKDDYVSLYVDGVIGNFAETKHYTNMIPTGKDEHYIILLENQEFIPVIVKNKKIQSEFDRICEETWNYLDNTSKDGETTTRPKGITVKGVVATLNPEIEGYYKEWLESMGVSPDENKVYYVTLDTTQTKMSVIGMALLSIAIGLMNLWFVITSIRKRKELKAMQENGETLSPAMQEDMTYETMMEEKESEVTDEE